MTPHHTPPEVQLLRNGVELFASMIEATQHAQHEVLLETYIFDFAGAGSEVAHALMAANAHTGKLVINVQAQSEAWEGKGPKPDVLEVAA